MATAPRTLDPDEPIPDVEDFLDHTHHNLMASVLTQPFAPPFVLLLADLDGHRAARSKLQKALDALTAQIIFVDDELNAILDAVKDALLADKSDFAAALYKDVFGSQSPSEVRRNILGPQLATMRVWPGKLSQSPDAVLQDLGNQTAQVVKKADDLLTAIGAAEAALQQFDLGPRAAFVEACNAAIKLVFGLLSEMEHNPPTKGQPLPAGFVDRFFLRDTSGRAPSTTDLKKAIARTKAKLKQQENALDARLAKEAKALKDAQDAELADKLAKAEATKKAADDAAADLARLQAEIAKGQGQ